MNELLLNFMRRQMDVDEDKLIEIAGQIPVETFKKGTILIEQGQIPAYCYFILKGMVRQYALTEEGEEITSEFYVEEDTVTIFNAHSDDKESKFTLECVEDSILIVGDLSIEEDMYEKYAILATVSMNIMQQEMGKLREAYAEFMASSPEARYKNLVENRPTLIDRVPQHLLASYLGVKPESLSRIKKRLKDS